MPSTDSVYSNDRLNKLLLRSKLKDAYESLDPSVSSYMNMVNSDGKNIQQSSKSSRSSSIRTSINISKVHEANRLVRKNEMLASKNKTKQPVFANENLASGSVTSRSNIAESHVFSRSATTVTDSETESIEKAGVSMISNFHRIASLAARASETVNTSRSQNNTQRSSSTVASYDPLKLMSIANQQACSYVYKYKLQVTCDFQSTKPANYFLFTTIPIKCQFSSINFEKQVPVVDPNTKLMTNCTMRFKLLHGKLDKISNKYAEAVYIFTSRMINLFENGFHKILYSTIQSGKARMPGRNYFATQTGKKTKLPHIKANGDIDFNILMAQFSDNVDVAYNYWAQQFSTKSKTQHERQHKLLNDYMIVPARQNFEQTDWVPDDDLMKDTFHKIFNPFESNDWEEGLSLGDDMLLYQDSCFVLPTQLLKLKKTKIREISYKIPKMPSTQRKLKKKNKTSALSKSKSKLRRKSTGDCKPIEYEIMSFKIPRPIKNLQTDVPMIKGFQLDEESMKQEKAIIAESEDVMRVNMRCLQFRALQHMTSFFEDLANVEDMTISHSKHHSIEKKIPIEKRLLENLDMYTNTMSNDHHNDEKQKHEFKINEFGLPDLASTIGSMGTATVRFMKKEATMWQRRKDAELNKFNSAINFNVVRATLPEQRLQRMSYNSHSRPVSTFTRAARTSMSGARVSISAPVKSVVLDALPEQVIAMSKVNSTTKLTKTNTHDYVFDRIIKKVTSVFSHLGMEKMDKNSFKLLMNRIITIRQNEHLFKQSQNSQRNRKTINKQADEFQNILDQVLYRIKTGMSFESKESKSKVIGTFHRQKGSAKLSDTDDAKAARQALLNRNMTKYDKIYEKFFATIANSKHKTLIEPQQIASVIKLGCNNIDSSTINFMLQWFQFSDVDTTENGLKRTGATVTFSDCFAAHLQNVHILLKNDFFLMHHELERQAKIASNVNNQPRRLQRYAHEATSVDHTLTIDVDAKLISVPEESRQSSRYQHFLTSRPHYNPASSQASTVEMYIRPVDKTSILVRHSDLSYLENNSQQQFDALLWLAVVFDCQDLVNQPIFEEWQDGMFSSAPANSTAISNDSSSQGGSASEVVINDLDAVLTSSEFKEIVIANHLNLQYFDHFRTSFVDDMFATLFDILSKHGKSTLTARYLQWFFEELAVDVMKLEYGNDVDDSSSSTSSVYNFEKCLNAAFDFYDTHNRELITASDLMIFENSHLRNVFALDLEKMFKHLFSEHFDQLVTSKECGITRQQFYALFEKQNDNTDSMDSVTHQAIKKFDIPECCKVFDKS